MLTTSIPPNQTCVAAQIPKVVKDATQLSRLKREMRRHYATIVAVFRHTAANRDARTGDIYNVYWGGWVALCHDIHVSML